MGPHQRQDRALTDDNGGATERPSAVCRFPSAFTRTSFVTGRSTDQGSGTLVVMDTGETVSESVEQGAATAVSTSSGAKLEIGEGVLLTDTVASITELSGEMPGGPEAGPLGSVYDVTIPNQLQTISGSVTIVLPYDADNLPPGTEPGDLEVSAFNGLSWINLGGSVNEAGPDREGYLKPLVPLRPDREVYARFSCFGGRAVGLRAGQGLHGRSPQEPRRLRGLHHP